MWTSEHVLTKTVEFINYKIRTLFTDIFRHVVNWKIKILKFLKYIVIDNSPKLQIKYIFNIR